MTSMTFEIGGMTCGHCVGRVKSALDAVPGVTVDRVVVGTATVSFDGAPVDRSVIVGAIEQAGYDVLPAR